MLARLRYAARALRGSLTLNLPVSPQVRRDFRLDALGALLYGIFNGGAVSYIYVVGRTIGVSPLGISALVAMPAIGSILSLPISLHMQGRNPRPFIFASWSAGRAAMLLVLLFSAPLPYVLIVAFFQLTSTLAIPFYAAIMQQVYPMEFRGRLMSLVRVGSGAVTTVSSLLTGWLLGSLHVPYGVIFAAGAGAALLSLLIFARITPIRAQPRPRQGLRQTFGVLRHNRPFALYQVAVMIMGLANIMAATLYPLVIVDRLHAGYGAYGVLTVCNSLGYLLSFFVWGRVVDRRGPLYTMGVIGMGVIVLPLGMLLAPGVLWLIPVALVTGITLAGFELGIYAAVIRYAPPHDVPQYMALHANFSGIRGLVGPFAAIALLGSGHHYTLALVSSLALACIGTAMLWQGARQEEGQLHPAT